MKELTEQQIIDSWHINASPWVTAIRDGEIESRVQVTNQAIIDVILARTPKSLLDIGCGEGWLVREMTRCGVEALGVDIVDELIDAAQQEGLGRFKPLAYHAVTHDTLQEHFDIAVCNFSLLGKESVEQLFENLPPLLNDGGALIVQTLHPCASHGPSYRDGWREGTWDGFSKAFSQPAPWYFRTIATWQRLFEQHGFILSHTDEPKHPQTGQPASVIFVGEKIT